MFCEVYGGKHLKIRCNSDSHVIHQGGSPGKGGIYEQQQSLWPNISVNSATFYIIIKQARLYVRENWPIIFTGAWLDMFACISTIQYFPSHCEHVYPKIYLQLFVQSAPFQHFFYHWSLN